VAGIEILSLSDSATSLAEACIAPAVDASPDDYDNCENSFLNCLATLQAPNGSPIPSSCQ
jgi:hypothetical protein